MNKDHEKSTYRKKNRSRQKESFISNKIIGI